ncbi:MAG: hypothetical protein FWG83_07835 [Oscillospiraceae bacterium]|nr:hypothetical protein [Oscillospiraceae bacterium]
MLRTYEGYWDDGRVLPIGKPIIIERQCRVLITVLENEPLKLENATENLNPFYILEANTSKTPVLGRYDGMVKIPDEIIMSPSDFLKAHP